MSPSADDGWRGRVEGDIAEIKIALLGSLEPGAPQGLVADVRTIRSDLDDLAQRTDPGPMGTPRGKKPRLRDPSTPPSEASEDPHPRPHAHARRTVRDAVRNPTRTELTAVGSTLLTILLGALQGWTFTHPPTNTVVPTPAPPAIEIACADGLDNDGDRHVDCDDQDCERVRRCWPPPEPRGVSPTDAPE